MITVEVQQPLSDLPDRITLSFATLPRIGEHFFHPNDKYLIFEVTAVIHFPSEGSASPKTAIHCIKVDRIPNVEFNIATEFHPD